MFPNIYSFRGGRGVSGDVFVGRVRRRPSLLSNLLAHWKLEEGSGVRYDSAQSHVMNPYGAVTRGSGKVGPYAAQFAGVTSDYLRCAGTGDLRMTGKSFTIAGWVYFDLLEEGPLVAKWDLGSLEYMVASDGAYLYFAVSGDGESSGMISNGVELQAAEWYHFVAWHDALGGWLKLALNNGAPASMSYTSGVFAGGSDLALGHEFAGGTYLTGRLDSVSIWTRCLSAEERGWLYNGGAGLDYPFGR